MRVTNREMDSRTDGRTDVHSDSKCRHSLRCAATNDILQLSRLYLSRAILIQTSNTPLKCFIEMSSNSSCCCCCYYRRRHHHHHFRDAHKNKKTTIIDHIVAQYTVSCFGPRHEQSITELIYQR